MWIDGNCQLQAHGFEALSPLALAQLNRECETATMTERNAQQRRVLRDTAQKLASSGNYAAALKSLRDANTHLQRSLRVSGVVVSQPQENLPQGMYEKI